MTMQKFSQVSGTAAPMMKANIDTDVIIPAKRLVGHKREELAAFAFEAHRYKPDGSDDPDFVLNKPRYRNANILIAGENFGCGSSREFGGVGDGRVRLPLRDRAGFWRYFL